MVCGAPSLFPSPSCRYISISFVLPNRLDTAWALPACQLCVCPGMPCSAAALRGTVPAPPALPHRQLTRLCLLSCSCCWQGATGGVCTPWVIPSPLKPPNPRDTQHVGACSGPVSGAPPAAAAFDTVSLHRSTRGTRPKTCRCVHMGWWRCVCARACAYPCTCTRTSARLRSMPAPVCILCVQRARMQCEEHAACRAGHASCREQEVEVQAGCQRVPNRPGPCAPRGACPSWTAATGAGTAGTPPGATCSITSTARAAGGACAWHAALHSRLQDARMHLSDQRFCRVVVQAYMCRTTHTCARKAAAAANSHVRQLSNITSRRHPPAQLGRDCEHLALGLRGRQKDVEAVLRHQAGGLRAIIALVIGQRAGLRSEPLLQRVSGAAARRRRRHGRKPRLPALPGVAAGTFAVSPGLPAPLISAGRQRKQLAGVRGAVGGATLQAEPVEAAGHWSAATQVARNGKRCRGALQPHAHQAPPCTTDRHARSPGHAAEEPLVLEAARGPRHDGAKWCCCGGVARRTQLRHGRRQAPEHPCAG